MNKPHREYSKSELILLKYADGHNTGDPFPGYFKHLHKINAEAVVNDFLADGFLALAPIDFILSRATTAELKDFLSTHGLKSKAQKSKMIEAITENVPVAKIQEVFPLNYYVLTTEGASYLQAHSNSDDYANRLDPILKGFDKALSAIKKRNYEEALQILSSEGHSPVKEKPETYDNFLTYNIGWPQGHEMSEMEAKYYFILYAMYGLRTEFATKDIKKRTGYDVDFSMIHKAKRIIKSIGEITAGSKLAETLLAGKSGLTVFYEIKSFKDGSVCPHCKEWEGRKLFYKDAVIGKTYPPFDHCRSDYCRCMALYRTE